MLLRMHALAPPATAEENREKAGTAAHMLASTYSSPKREAGTAVAVPFAIMRLHAVLLYNHTCMFARDTRELQKLLQRRSVLSRINLHIHTMTASLLNVHACCS